MTTSQAKLLTPDNPTSEAARSTSTRTSQAPVQVPVFHLTATEGIHSPASLQVRPQCCKKRGRKKSRTETAFSNRARRSHAGAGGIGRIFEERQIFVTHCKTLNSKAIWNRAVQRNKPESWFFITWVPSTADPASLRASAEAAEEKGKKMWRQESLNLTGEIHVTIPNTSSPSSLFLLQTAAFYFPSQTSKVTVSGTSLGRWETSNTHFHTNGHILTSEVFYS